MNIKCYACGNDKHISEYGTITICGSAYNSIIGKLSGDHLGSVDVYVCHNCGTLISDMRGKINPERKKITYKDVWDRVEDIMIKQNLCRSLEPINSSKHSIQGKALIALMQAIVDILNERY